MNEMTKTMIWRFALHTAYNMKHIERYGDVYIASCHRSSEIDMILQSAGIDYVNTDEYWKAREKYLNMDMEELFNLVYPL